jgi:hypothetical protein
MKREKCGARYARQIRPVVATLDKETDVVELRRSLPLQLTEERFEHVANDWMHKINIDRSCCLGFLFSQTRSTRNKCGHVERSHKVVGQRRRARSQKTGVNIAEWIIPQFIR